MNKRSKSKYKGNKAKTRGPNLGAVVGDQIKQWYRSGGRTVDHWARHGEFVVLPPGGPGCYWTREWLIEWGVITPKPLMRTHCEGLRRLKQHGGFTWDVFNGCQPESGYAVAMPNEELCEFNRALISSAFSYFLSTRLAVITLLGHGVCVGGWLDRDSGLYYFDVVALVETPEEAYEACKAWKQIAYYDLAKGVEVRV
jgi:hypothetical protein